MLQVKDLRQTFRSKDRKSKGATVEAVRSINFTFEKGEIFGLGVIASWTFIKAMRETVA